jgi:hypothetical protein
LALWSRADTTTKTTTRDVPSADASSRQSAVAAKSHEFNTWLTALTVLSADATSRPSAATQGAASCDLTTWLAPAVQPADTSRQSAVEPRDICTWLAPAASKFSPIPAPTPVNLLANWSWQPPEPTNQFDPANLNLSKLSLIDPPAHLQEWLIRTPTPSSNCSVRGSTRYVSGSESSEIMILDAENDENIDFPEDQDI